MHCRMHGGERAVVSAIAEVLAARGRRPFRRLGLSRWAAGEHAVLRLPVGSSHCYAGRMLHRVKEWLDFVADVASAYGYFSAALGASVSGIIGGTMVLVLSSNASFAVGAAIICTGVGFGTMVWARTHWGRMPMSLGARLAYESLRDTLAADFARKIAGGDPERVFNFFATAIAREPGVRVRGVRRPAAVEEGVDAQEIRDGSITGGGRVLSFSNARKAPIVDLSVRARDVRAAIKRLRHSDQLLDHRQQ